MVDIKKARILIVDDDADIRQMLTLLFEAEGVSGIDTAVNGADGLSKLQAYHEPRVVFLDLMMPVCSGWDVLQKIQASPELQKHKIAVMSASRPKASELNGHEFFPKPLELQDLIEFVASAV